MLFTNEGLVDSASVWYLALQGVLYTVGIDGTDMLDADVSDSASRYDDADEGFQDEEEEVVEHEHTYVPYYFGYDYTVEKCYCGSRRIIETT